MRAAADLLTVTDAGLYCPAGDFHIDPWAPVPRAVITHAHGDHASPGSATYLAAAPGLPLLQARLPEGTTIEGRPYGERLRIGAAEVSFHPAGHVLGSAQIRIAARGRTWVVTGDYKLADDPTCAAFEPVRCDVLVSESTFGLPVFRWPPVREVVASLAAWWDGNRADGVTTVVFAYALGKAQRTVSELARHYGGRLPGPVFCHGAVARINDAYRRAGMPLPETRGVATAPPGTRWSDALVIAPPAARGTRWMTRFGAYETGFVSGWMALRTLRRRTAYDRGFALSDHADWDALNTAVGAADPELVWVTHGYREPFVRWLQEHGRAACAVQTRFKGEQGAEPPDAGGDAGEDPGQVGATGS